MKRERETRCMLCCCIAGEWEQSIRDSHPACEETDTALGTHRQEVERIRIALQKYNKPIEQLITASGTLAAYAAASEADRACREGDVQQAVGVLQQAAAHVKWF
jgi:hypothetical protein